MPSTDQWPYGKSIQKLLLPISEKLPVAGSTYTHARRLSMSYDMHFALEFGIVLSGRMQREYRDGKYTVGVGGVWYCGIWEPHGWRVLRAPCRVVVLVIQPQALAQMRFDEAPWFDPMRPFTGPPLQRPQPRADETARICDLGERLWEICRSRPSYYTQWLRLLFQECLLVLNRHSSDRRPPMSTEYAGRINRAIEAVYQNNRLITAQEAADLCGMSRNRFNKAFTSMIGISFARYALRYRLNGAAAMLAQGDLPLKQVAAEWGFTDASHLHHCFVQHYGCGPADYRRRSNQPNSTALYWTATKSGRH